MCFLNFLIISGALRAGLTGMTHAGKRDPAVFHRARLRRLLQQRFRKSRAARINDRAAGAADKVHMRRDVRVEPLEPVHRADRDDQPLLPEEIQVAVDRAEAEIRDLRLEPGVDPVSRRMRLGGAEAFVDGVALFAVLPRAFFLLASS